MAAVVQGVGDQTRLAESLRDVVVAAGVLTESVRQDQHRARLGVGCPDVVDEVHAAKTVEASFIAGGSHYGQRNGSWSCRPVCVGCFG